MRIAERAGVKTVPHGLLQMNGQFAYITKRIDRKITGKQRLRVQKYAMEDFCQLGKRMTEDKYNDPTSDAPKSSPFILRKRLWI